MIERNITRGMVKNALLHGQVIKNYADDRPFPSALILGFSDGEPLHVVVAFDDNRKFCHIITAYKPDRAHFEDDFKTRKPDER